MRCFSKIWKLLGDTKFAVFIFYLTSAIAIIGSLLMKKNPYIFFPLKYTNIQEWMLSYGIRNLSYIWWLPILFVLLFIVAVSVFVCSLNLLKDKFLFLAHIGFLLTLFGLFISHTLSFISTGNILTKGAQIRIPSSGILLKLEDMKISYFPKNTILLGKANDASDCSAVLLIQDQKKICKKKLSLNRPCLYKGFTLFIEDFYPKQKFNAPCWINLTIRKDYGLPLIFTGSLLFLAGLLGVLLR